MHKKSKYLFGIIGVAILAIFGVLIYRYQEDAGRKQDQPGGQEADGSGVPEGKDVLEEADLSVTGQREEELYEDLEDIREYQWVYEDVSAILEEYGQLRREGEWGVPYVDDETFAILKAAYAELDFNGEFETGEPEVYEEYRRKFWNLMQGEGLILNRETGEECSISEFLEESFSGEEEEYDPGNHYYTYYFFDMDGDGCPELGIREWYRPIYFLRYDEEEDQFCLWYQMSEYRPTGTGKGVSTDGESWCRYIFLDKNADIECETYFFCDYWGVGVYLMMLDKTHDMELTQEMENQGIYVCAEDQCFFRVTREQYFELADLCFEAYEKYIQEKYDVQYSYEELFGDLMQESSQGNAAIGHRERMTEKEAAEVLWHDVHQATGRDVSPIKADPPSYDFIFLDDEDMECSLVKEGLSADGLYYCFGRYEYYYGYDYGTGERFFSHRHYVNSYAVNRETGEIYPWREDWNDETGDWDYNEEYERIARMGREEE